MNDDENIIFYVAGAIERDISRAIKCSYCKETLLKKRKIDVEFEECQLLEKIFLMMI